MGNRIVVQTVDFGECGEKDVSFAVDYSPAEAPRGMSGPWEDSSPGNSSECEVTGATLYGHDIFWMFDAEGLALIADAIREELDGEDADIDEPEDCDDAPYYDPDYEARWAA